MSSSFIWSNPKRKAMVLIFFFAALLPSFAFSYETCRSLFTDKTKVFNPAQVFSDTKGLYKQVGQREIPILSNLFTSHKVAVIRTYESEKYMTDVVNVEQRLGPPQELIRRCSREELWPKDKAGNILEASASEATSNFGQRIKQEILSRGYGVAARVKTILNQVDREGRNEWGKIYGEALEFAIENYGRRDWTPEFKEQLRKQAKDFAGGSTYIIVRQKNQTGGKGRIVGTMRLYRAPFGRRIEKDRFGSEVLKDEVGDWGPSYSKIVLGPENWRNSSTDVDRPADPEGYRAATTSRASTPYLDVPMEDGLKIKLPREVPVEGPFNEIVDGELKKVYWGSGEIIEPGTYAIDKEANAEAFSEILIQLLGFMTDTNFPHAYNLSNRLYYTYNDLPRLYTILGFKKMETQPVIKNGTKWFLLKATGQDLILALNKLTEIKSNLDFKRLEQIKSFFMEAGALSIERNH